MLRTLSALACSILLAAALAGCELAGGAIENYRKDSKKEVLAEYRGLEGKSFAVVVAADRYIQSDYPMLVDYLTTRITELLAKNTNEPLPGGFVPAEDVLRYLYDNPGWTAKSMADIAQGLGGVQRIVYVELSEYQLREPGNQYEWDGVASGTVAVVEIDGTTPDEYAFQKPLTVRFPDGKGYGPDQLPESAVSTELARRFVDRTAWTMLDHYEMYYPKY